jgi:hypothetical protein
VCARARDEAHSEQVELGAERCFALGILQFAFHKSKFGSKDACVPTDILLMISAAACPADIGLHLRWNMFGMKEVQRPSPILVAALNHDFDGVTDAAVGFDSCISQIIESSQDVVVPKRREREPRPTFVDDFASSKPAETCGARADSFGQSSHGEIR